MLVINECPVGPQLLRDFFAREQLARPAKKHKEHLERLRVQFDKDSLPAKLSRGRVCFKCSEAVAPGWL